MSYNGKQFSFKLLRKKAHLSNGGNSVTYLPFQKEIQLALYSDVKIDSSLVGLVNFEVEFTDGT